MATERLTCGVNASESVADAVEPVAMSVAVAVFSSGLDVMPGAKATGTVNTSELPGPAPTMPLVMLKLVPPMLPMTGAQVALPFAVQETFAVSVSPGGSRSVTVTSRASLAPELVTVTT